LAVTGLASTDAPPFGVARCAACRFFIGTPAALERAIAGLNILSSAYGSVRGDTGLCDRHDLFTTAASAACPQFEENPSIEARRRVSAENLRPT
jgi:hypothetical protein